MLMTKERASCICYDINSIDKMEEQVTEYWSRLTQQIFNRQNFESAAIMKQTNTGRRICASWKRDVVHPRQVRFGATSQNILP